MARLRKGRSRSYPGRPVFHATCVVSSEITGRGYLLPNVPAQMMECSASFVRYELKKADREWYYAASCGVIRMVRRQESAEAIVASSVFYRGECRG